MKKHIKRISILLTVLMILSAFPMVSAYEYVSPDNVTYLDASFATVGTENWYAWTWSDNSNGRWVQGTEVSYRVYSFNYLDNNVLFARVDKTKQADWNNGSVYNQTEDLVNHTADYYYVITAWNSSSSDKMQGKWEFVGPDKPPTDPTEVYYTVEPPTTDPVTEPSTDNAHDSLYNTYQRIRDSIPVGGTPYTKESQQRFNAALRAAEDLLDDATATDTQLREAEQELKDAYNSLEYSTADRTKLWTAIEKLRTIIESGEYKNYSNADELKEIYDYALPVVYYEPDQSVIDEWEAKIYAALQKAGVITEPTTEPNYTEPYTTGYTEPTATTEDPTGHCTEFDLPYSPDFAVALANYTNNLMGESLSVSDIDIFHYDQTTVVFGLSDNLCTEGHENIDGYHFENWNFFPREANKTGYCVYYNGTIYNLPDAVSNNIMTASALASIIPHSSKLEGSTQPTETTESSQPIITEPTDPTTTTEDPTGHCTDNEEMFRQIFATELAEYSNELGYEEPFSIEDVEFFYRNSGSMAVFALRDKWCTVSEETIGNYKFTNPSFFGNPKNKTGLCVYYNNTIFSIAKAVQEGYVTAEFLASVIPNTTFVGSTETTEATQPTQGIYDEVVQAIVQRHADAGVQPYHVNVMYLKQLKNGKWLLRYSVSIFLYTQEMHVEHFGKWTYETANPAAEIYDNGNFYSFTEAYEKGIITDNDMPEICSEISGLTKDEEPTTQITPTEVTAPTTDPEPLWMTAMRAFKVYLGSLYDGYYDVSKTTYLGKIGEDCELLYGWGYEEPVSGGYIQIGSYKIWAPATTPFQSAGLFIYKNGEIKLLKDAFADGDVTDVERIISLIKAADKSLGFEITDITQTDNTEPASTQSATTETVPAVKYDIRNAKFSSISAKTYTGKAITPAVKVTYGGKTLVKNKDYTVSYGNNKNAGAGTITVKGIGSYTNSKKIVFKINKAANTMTAKATAKTVKYSQLKNAKQTVSAITVKKAIGKVSYKKTSGKSFFTVNTETGKITIKKGTQKGTYTIKVKVTAAGNSNYKSASKTVTVKIKVK